MSSDNPINIRAPGRVCLFGEHSDYLGLDVIAASIDLEIKITASPRNDDTIVVKYRDLNTEDEFPIGTLLGHKHERDYLRSSFNVIRDNGIIPEYGWDIEVSGTIPFAGGLSSSSALTVASIMLAAQIGGKELRPVDVARYSHEAEVERFGESGGMMDHYASACGGIIHVSMGSDQKVTELPAEIKGFIIGDSRLKKKDTVGDLKEIRNLIEAGYDQIHNKLPDFNPRTTPVNRVYELSRSRPSAEVAIADASLRNRDLTASAFKLLGRKNPDEEELGNLLNDHQEILRDYFGRSTPKLDNMIEASLNVNMLIRNSSSL